MPTNREKIAEIRNSKYALPNALHPLHPGLDVHVGDDLELPLVDHIDGVGSQVVTLDVPLRLQDWLDHVLAATESNYFF